MDHYVLERSYGLGIGHPTQQWVFMAPSDEAAAKAGPYRCRIDCWPDGTRWSVSRYLILTVDDEGQTVSPACISNFVGFGTYHKGD